MFTLTYEVEEAGWATATVGNGEQSVEMRLSYMGNPLAELAALACLVADVNGPETSDYDWAEVVSFVDEPGRYELSLGSLKAYFSGRPAESFPSSMSWPLDSQLEFVLKMVENPFYHEDPSQIRELRGTTTAREFAQTVLTVLDAILERHGFNGYRQRWCSNDFPLTYHARLVAELRNTSMVVPMFGTEPT